MLELLFLLLPIAASYGWYMGYRNATQNKLKTAQLSGLNYDSQQQSFQNLTESLDINAQTIETHLALGAIFRQRGDAKNAIRIHQHITKQTNISARHYQSAQVALARDFIEIGSYERGEQLLLQVIQSEQNSTEAQHELLLCYQKMKDWQKGIQLNETYQLVKNPQHQKPLANFLCELAIRNSCMTAQLRLTHKALQIAPHSARALYQTIVCYNKTKAFKQARKSIQVFASKHPGFIADLLPHAKTSFAQSEHAYENFLKQHLKTHTNTTVMCELANLWKSQPLCSKAEQMLIERLHHDPSLQGFEKLIEIQMLNTQKTKNLATLKKLFHQHSAQHMGYCCHQCGFKFERLYWACPACYHWESVYQPHITPSYQVEHA
jgi:lipopolysaccharide biosynthesis regulator YciM